MLWKKQNILVLAIFCSIFIVCSRPPTFQAELSGANVSGKGSALFYLDVSGTKLRYEVSIEKIETISSITIHQAFDDSIGQTVVQLFPLTDNIIDGAAETVSEGFGAEGTITSNSLVGPMENDALDQLIVAMRKRNAYVIVTTQEYPEGAIRGRIQHEPRLK